jgi:prepilin-type N-terminal cleavage/methylation domain-containing protein
MPMPRRRARKAFTLIEILCVVIILAIAAAMVCAGLVNTNDIQCESGARTVLTDLMYAQNRAIATQQYVYVTFNTANATYSLCSSLNPVTYLTNPITQANYTNTFGSGALSNLPNCFISGLGGGLNGYTSMYFDQLGTPYYCSGTGTGGATLASIGTIVIQSGLRTVTISIQPDTGDMTVQ